MQLSTLALSPEQVAILRHCTRFDPAAGCLYWLTPDKWGLLATRQYGSRLFIRFPGGDIPAPEVAWLHAFGSAPASAVHLINGNIRDMRPENLTLDPAYALRPGAKGRAIEDATRRDTEKYLAIVNAHRLAQPNAAPAGGDDAEDLT